VVWVPQIVNARVLGALLFIRRRAAGFREIFLLHAIEVGEDFPAAPLRLGLLSKHTQRDLGCR